MAKDILDVISRYRADGWTLDRDCRLLQGACHVVNGPIYIKSPEGRMHAITPSGNVKVLDGECRRLGPPTGIQRVIYRCGILAEVAGKSVVQEST